jgi:hypothetical protein
MARATTSSRWRFLTFSLFTSTRSNDAFHVTLRLVLFRLSANTFTMIANINARMEGVSNIIANPVTYILMVNKDKKVVRWSGIWDNNNEADIKAFEKLGVSFGFPKVENAPMLITRAEGEALASGYLKAVSDGFLNNNHAELCRDFVAENVSWGKLISSHSSKLWVSIVRLYCNKFILIPQTGAMAQRLVFLPFLTFIQPHTVF